MVSAFGARARLGVAALGALAAAVLALLAVRGTGLALPDPIALMAVPDRRAALGPTGWFHETDTRSIDVFDPAATGADGSTGSDDREEAPGGDGSTDDSDADSPTADAVAPSGAEPPDTLTTGSPEVSPGGPGAPPVTLVPEGSEPTLPPVPTLPLPLPLPTIVPTPSTPTTLATPTIPTTPPTTIVPPVTVPRLPPVTVTPPSIGF